MPPHGWALSDALIGSLHWTARDAHRLRPDGQFVAVGLSRSRREIAVVSAAEISVADTDLDDIRLLASPSDCLLSSDAVRPLSEVLPVVRFPMGIELSGKPD